MISIRKPIALRWMRAVLIIFTVVSFFPTYAYAETNKEDAVRVGFFPLHGFYEYDSLGRLSGYGVEYLMAAATYGGFAYTFVEVDNWETALEMLRKGEIDLLAPAQLTAERSEQFLYSAFPIGTEYGALLALSTNDSLIYEDYQAFDQMKIGCVSTIVFMDAFLDCAQKNGFTPDLRYYKDTAALTAALQAGEVDAILANLMVKTDTMKVLDKFGAAPVYYLLNKERFDLANQINDAIQELTLQSPHYQNDLTKQYFPYYTQVPFTKAELAYIEQLGPLVVGMPTDFAPVSYLDEDGQVAGIDRKILERIAALSGLQFEYLPLPTDAVTYDYLREHQVQIVANVEKNAMNMQAKGLHTTNPYLSMSKVFVGKNDMAYDLSGPLRVAVASASQNLFEVLAVEYPNYEVIRYETTAQCFDAVLKGEADIILQNRYVVEPLLHAPQYDGLMILPMEALESKFCLSIIVNQAGSGIADDVLSDSKLVSIFNKSIALIPDTEIEEFMTVSVVENRYQYGLKDFFYQYRVPICIIGLMVLIALAAFAYAYMTNQKSSQRIQESEWKLRNITNNINGGVVVLRANEGMEITYANDGFLELMQCTREEFEKLYQSSYLACVHPDDLSKINRLLKHPVSDHIQISIQLRIRQNNGDYLKAMFNGTLSQKENGEKELYCVIMDISMQAELLEKLHIEKKRTDLLLEKSDEIIYEVDLIKKEIYVSRSLKEKFGWTFPAHVDHFELPQVLSMWHIVEEDKPKLLENTRVILSEGIDVECTVRLLKEHVGAVWCRVAQYPIQGDDQCLVSIVGRIIDVDTETKEKIALEEKSQRDPLTGLYNKEAFAVLVKKYLQSEKHVSSALLFIDLDHFKRINDSLGHMVGDKVIQDVSRKLQIIFSNYDILARFGGDEFCVFVKDIPIDTLKDKLDWLLEKLQQCYEDHEKCVQISGSVGVAYTDVVGTNYAHLLACADKALYRSKAKGRNQYTFYEEEQALY